MYFFNHSINLFPVPPSILIPNNPKNLSTTQPINFNGKSRNPTIAAVIPALNLSINDPSVLVNAFTKSNKAIKAVKGQANRENPFITPLTKVPINPDPLLNAVNPLIIEENAF